MARMESFFSDSVSNDIYLFDLLLLTSWILMRELMNRSSEVSMNSLNSALNTSVFLRYDAGLIKL
jgi:hypothetical protein